MTLRFIVKKLFALVVLLSPITVWFALNSIVRLPVAIIIMLFGFFIMIIPSDQQTLKRTTFELEDILLTGWFFSACFAVLYNIDIVHSKMLSNFAAIFLLVFGFYFFLKTILNYLDPDLKFVARYFYYASLILYSIVLSEFVLNNFFGIYLMDYFALAPVYNSPGFGRAIWYSSSSPTEEPGQIAYYTNLFWAFGILHLGYAGKERFILWFNLLHFICLVITVSTAGVFFFLLALGYYIIRKQPAKRVAGWIVASTVFGMIVYFTNVFSIQEKVGFYLDNSEFLTKIALNTAESKSSSDRVQAWQKAAIDFNNSPVFGNGPGYNRLVTNFSYHGLFTYTAACMGVLGLIFILLFFVGLALRIQSFEKNERVLFQIVFFMAIAKNLISDGYLNIPFWLVIVVILFYDLRKRKNLENHSSHANL